MTGRRMIDRWQDDNKSFLSLTIKERILPTIYGGIIGDMLGVRVEFRKRETFHIDDIRDMAPIINLRERGLMTAR